MKTRLSAMAVVISSISMLTACGGGGGSPTFAASTPPPAPTVTVTAPATATVNASFDVAWSSTGANSCSSSDLTGVSAGSGSVPVTETVAATKTYSVTCTNGTDSATSSATVLINPPPTAEGAWEGTSTVSGSDHALAGVVTKEGNYWLAYTQSGNGAVVGFYTGNGVSSANSATGGTFESSNLHEINFTGGFSGGGNAAGGLVTSGVYTGKTSFSGTLEAVAPGAATGAVFNTGKITSTGKVSYQGTDFTTETGVSTADTTLDSSTLTMHVKINIYVDSTTSGDTFTTQVLHGTFTGGVFTPTSGTLTVDSCTGSSQICATVGSTTAFDSVTGSINVNTGGTFTTSLSVDQGIILTRTGTYTFPAPDSQVLSSLPSITAGAFSLPTYNAAYETAPALSALAGNYAGSVGVGVAMQTSATFNITSSGAITGSGGGCSYTGNAVTHPSGGNLYDVTLTFSGCAYSSSAFTGTVLYDATTSKITVMAVNTGSDTGFLFTGTKP